MDTVMSVRVLVPLVILLGYVAVLVILAVADSRRASASQYMIGRRSIGAFATMASIAGNLRDGAGLAAWVLLGIYYGFGALWLTAGLCAALMLLVFFARDARRVAAERDYISVHQIVKERIGPITGRLAILVIALTALLYAGAQVYVSGRLFAAIFAVPAAAGIALSSTVVGLYLFIGGYYTTIRTGVVQWLIIMVILLMPWLVSHGHTAAVPIGTILSPGLLTGFSFFAISFLVVFSSPDIWQLIFSAASPRVARQGIAMTIPVYLAISVGLVFFARAVQEAVGSTVEPADAFFALFHLDSISPVVVGIIGIFLAASIMSTLDSQVFLFVSTLVREMLPGTITTDNLRMEKQSRLVLIATMVTLAFIAGSVGDLIEFLFGAVTLGTILAPVFILALLPPRSVRPYAFVDRAIAAVLICAGIVYTILFIGGCFKDLVYTLIPATISAVGCAVVPLLHRQRSYSSAS
jgi:Na+/proline symporter